MRVRCDACRGHKKIMGLGMMETECDKCEGSGRIDESELAPIEPQISVEHYLKPQEVQEIEIPEAKPIVTPTQAKKAARENR